MPSYLRKWNDRIILVRPTKWDGVEEVPPWDCLDITPCRRGKNRKYRKGLSAEKIEESRHGERAMLLHNLASSMSYIIRQNPQLYRSRQFCKKYADNPRMSNPLFGCCVVAAEAIYFLPPDDYQRRLYRAKDYEGIWHWWTTHIQPNNPAIELDSPAILDPTHKQFHSYLEDRHKAPYEDGNRTSPMGWKQSPSKRTLDLIADTADFEGFPCFRYKTYDASFRPPSTPGNLEAFME